MINVELCNKMVIGITLQFFHCFITYYNAFDIFTGVPHIYLTLLKEMSLHLPRGNYWKLNSTLHQPNYFTLSMK